MDCLNASKNSSLFIYSGGSLFMSSGAKHPFGMWGVLRSFKTRMALNEAQLLRCEFIKNTSQLAENRQSHNAPQ